jgi:hypothetical protein
MRHCDMLANAKWQTVSWRTETKGKLKARFAAVRIRIADGQPMKSTAVHDCSLGERLALAFSVLTRATARTVTSILIQYTARAAMTIYSPSWRLVSKRLAQSPSILTHCAARRYSPDSAARTAPTILTGPSARAMTSILAHNVARTLAQRQRHSPALRLTLRARGTHSSHGSHLRAQYLIAATANLRRLCGHVNDSIASRCAEMSDPRFRPHVARRAGYL